MKNDKNTKDDRFDYERLEKEATDKYREKVHDAIETFRSKDGAETLTIEKIESCWHTLNEKAKQNNAEVIACLTKSLNEEKEIRKKKRNSSPAD
jgi:hypothetical protein